MCDKEKDETVEYVILECEKYDSDKSVWKIIDL